MARRILRFLILLAVSWCVMTMVHESGHIVCGWVCGGTLRDAELLPWHLPHSSFSPDPRPLIRLWGGPLLGVLVPVILAVLVRRDVLWFVAHLCLLANGMYLATAWFTGERYLDTAQLLEHGASPVAIVLYCLVTIPIGYLGFRRQCIRVLASTTTPDHEER